MKKVMDSSVAWVGVLLLMMVAWLRADAPRRDDRGSDSTEKAWMIGAAIVVGGIVTYAVTSYVTSKTGTFGE